LRQRFLESDGAGIPDYEILELLLFAAKPRADVKPLAKALLREFDDLAGVLGAEPARLQRIAGCGPSAIAILKAAREAGVRMLRGQVMGRHAIGNWQALLDYCRGALARAPTEEFHVLFLDRKNHLIADERQGRGTVDHTPVYPREVVKRALELQASAIIMVHNHPSGDPTPSHADIDMTRQLRDAAKGVGISLHDHVIVGANGHSSFKSLGLL
jgi:DNA repair protein RadC